MADELERLTAALSDRYAIQRELGSGGMAMVYLATDFRDERNATLEVLKPGLSVILRAERFLAEIKVTAHLQHPNILPLHDSIVEVADTNHSQRRA
jgi:serine/threonine protein kinase